MFLLLLTFLTMFNLHAKDRTQQELLRLARQVLSSTTGMKVQSRNMETMQPKVLYETNEMALVGYQSAGFVVMAKDVALNPILGYSYSAFSDGTNNPGFQMWLAATAHALEAGTVSTPSVPDGLASEIPSFIATKWNQNAPYNLLCPTYTSNGSTKNYPSGCVATAMAQAMYYYKYPECGTSKRIYRFDPGTGVQETVSVQLDDIKFDWNNMLETYYSGKYTDAEGNAVAELMMACGAAVEMQYTASGSGSYVYQATNALRNYFGYDRGLPYHRLDFETSSEFYGNIYQALSEKIPVVFGGQSTSGGHCFVLDGYSQDGLVSVNWGWGGQQDGMFNIQTLNGYSTGQEYCTLTNQGKYPTYISKMCIYDGGTSILKVDDTHIKVTTTGLPLNIDAETYKGNIYVTAQNIKTGECTSIAVFTISAPVSTFYYASQTMLSKPYITIVNKLDDGDYRLFLSTKTEEETSYSPLRTTDDYTNSSLMTVNDGKITSMQTENDPGWMATGISLVANTPITVSSNVNVYNMNGQKVAASHQGVIVRKGMKYCSK